LRSRPTGTYVYCLIAARRRPSLAHVPTGLAGLGRVRLLDIEAGRWLAVADAPAAQYNEREINRRLSDLGWVSRAAVSHEAMVEAFVAATAVLPMKLFTIFTSDDRALEHVRNDRRRIEVLLQRVSNHHEWGVRVAFDRLQTSSWVRRRGSRPGRTRNAAGADYLRSKKAYRDAAVQLAQQARRAVAELYARLADRSRSAKRRSASELPTEGGPLLLDAAFLVPTRQTSQFRALIDRQRKTLEPQGYRVRLSGPWPPYSFVQD
jgi:hypothetical protein